MKKIIALALALIMALSMGVVALAAGPYYGNNANGYTGATLTQLADGSLAIAPGTKIVVTAPWGADALKGAKISYDFTTGELNGASYIESVKAAKNKTDLEIKVKESYTMVDEKAVNGIVKVTFADKTKGEYAVKFALNNNTDDISGSKKADEAVLIACETPDFVQIMDEDGGYVKFTYGEMTGTVKMNKEEKVYLNITAPDADTKDAIDEYLGEDFDAIVEMCTFEAPAFKNDVAFRYDAYEEDPHFFYLWDGEKLVDLGAKYDDDEDVDDYVWTAAAKGTFVITDEEVVLAAEETKNPDTGANDVVGVAAALAVVSLVAAGAVSLKK